MSLVLIGQVYLFLCIIKGNFRMTYTFIDKIKTVLQLMLTILNIIIHKVFALKT